MNDPQRIFEIWISMAPDGGYRLRAEFTDEKTDTSQPIGEEHRPPEALDFDELRQLQVGEDKTAYGRRLALFLFGEDGLLAGFQRAHNLTEAFNGVLHLRLRIDRDVEELHWIDWERLARPDGPGRPMSSQTIALSRFVQSTDWRRRDQLPPRDPKALLALANPSNLGDVFDPTTGNSLPDFDGEELKRARNELSGWRQRELLPGSVTLDALVEAMSKGVDLVYLVCHGVRRGNRVILVLENTDGEAEMVAAKDLLERLDSLSRLPRVVILGMCHSAEDRDQPLAALGPQLCEVGIPAVVAMQGRFTLESERIFMPDLLREIRDQGQLDIAIAHARNRLLTRGRDDWSVPTLFTRLRHGRVWSRSVPWEQFGKWDALTSTLRNKTCVPVVGAGASDWVVGGRAEIAQRFAERYAFPLSRYRMNDLPQVTQFVKVQQSEEAMRDALRQHVKEGLDERFGHLFSGLPASADIDARVLCAAREIWRQSLPEVHLALARRELPLYVTTEPIDLMAQSLEAIGKTPIRAYYRWRSVNPATGEAIEWPDDELNNELIDDPGFVANDPDRPVVYHLYGTLKAPGSVAVTEDDYFEYLHAFRSQESDNIHPCVAGSLTQRNVLYLGFDIDDWDIRVLLRSLQTLPGNMNRQQKTNLAVQLDPDADIIVSEHQAREYLGELFKNSDISVYWGTLDAFLEDVERKVGPPTPRPPSTPLARIDPSDDDELTLSGPGTA